MAEHHDKNQQRQKPFNPPGVERPFNHDMAMISEIKGALMRGTESAGIDIRVSVERGTVRLFGVVDVLSHREVAEEIVRQIPGVGRIENEITVANEETASDVDLQEAITRKLAHHRTAGNVGCKVRKGIVTLVGHAGTNDDVQSAVRLVQGTAGVKEVRLAGIKVGEGRDDDDADVSRKAQRLLEQLGFNPQQFQIYCDAGTLFIKGFVATRGDRSRIKIAMHTISGVNKLEALLVTDDQFGGEVH